MTSIIHKAPALFLACIVHNRANWRWGRKEYVYWKFAERHHRFWSCFSDLELIVLHNDKSIRYDSTFYSLCGERKRAHGISVDLTDIANFFWQSLFFFPIMDQAKLRNSIRTQPNFSGKIKSNWEIEAKQRIIIIHTHRHTHATRTIENHSQIPWAFSGAVDAQVGCQSRACLCVCHAGFGI